MPRTLSTTICTQWDANEGDRVRDTATGRTGVLIEALWQRQETCGSGCCAWPEGPVLAWVRWDDTGAEERVDTDEMGLEVLS